MQTSHHDQARRRGVPAAAGFRLLALPREVRVRIIEQLRNISPNDVPCTLSQICATLRDDVLLVLSAEARRVHAGTPLPKHITVSEATSWPFCGSARQLERALFQAVKSRCITNVSALFHIASPDIIKRWFEKDGLYRAAAMGHTSICMLLSSFLNVKAGVAHASNDAALVHGAAAGGHMSLLALVWQHAEDGAWPPNWEATPGTLVNKAMRRGQLGIVRWVLNKLHKDTARLAEARLAMVTGALEGPFTLDEVTAFLDESGSGVKDKIEWHAGAWRSLQSKTDWRAKAEFCLQMTKHHPPADARDLTVQYGTKPLNWDPAMSLKELRAVDPRAGKERIDWLLDNGYGPVSSDIAWAANHDDERLLQRLLAVSGGPWTRQELLDWGLYEASSVPALQMLAKSGARVTVEALKEALEADHADKGIEVIQWLVREAPSVVLELRADPEAQQVLTKVEENGDAAVMAWAGAHLRLAARCSVGSMGSMGNL